MLKTSFYRNWIVFALLAIGAGACGDDEPAPEGPGVIVTVPDAGACDGSDCTADGAMMSVCGDGVVNAPSEACDDGNKIGGDGCNAACLLETCGNGSLDPGESCEPPNTAMCGAGCVALQSTCGNGKVDKEQGEQCDDANDLSGDGCRACRAECGDGLLDRTIGEECEPQFTKLENGVSTTCTAECRRKPFCGDGKVNVPGEECEPVNGTTCVGSCTRAQNPDAGINGCVPIRDAGAADMPSNENLVPNPDFATDLNGWNAGPTVTAAFVPDEGATAPGSAKVTFTAGTGPAFSVDGISRCVAVTAGEFLEFKAKYFNPASQTATGIAFPVLLLYASIACTGPSLSSGAAGTATTATLGKWLDYKRIVDTTTAGTKGAPASLLIKLGVLVGSGKTSTVQWDDVSLQGKDMVPFDPNCGNCITDRGETCDDGNRVRGDGCGSFCQRERDCGNGVVEAPEQCDLGMVAFKDTKSCTPLCKTKTACDDCLIGKCASQVDVCYGLQGVAQGGPRQGEERSLLCGRLRDCVQATGCAGTTAVSNSNTLNGMKGEFLENCYCGNSGVECLTPGLANGSCQAEVEAALETKLPSQIVQRMGGTDAKYPIFAAVNEIRACQGLLCRSECNTTLKCGDGVIQDRDAVFASFLLPLQGRPQTCADGDRFTPSGKGCTFEECDSTMSCDENCFVLKCGNGLKQEGEECDDGNTASTDGCDANCKAEFKCGDNKVDAKFGETCDPPNTGLNCSLAESKADPSKCGCGSTCQFKACGNEIVQEGEECDPPNGTTCGADCKRVGLNECTQCLLLVTKDGSGMPDEIGKQLLEGIPQTRGFETGCIEDKPCFDLLQCILTHKCGGNISQVECYCGTDQASIDSCESDSFKPKGPCADLTKDAYKSQFDHDPTNLELVTDFFTFTGLASVNDGVLLPGRQASMGIAHLLAFTNLGTGVKTFEERLAQSLVPANKVQSCVAACALPWNK